MARIERSAPFFVRDGITVTMNKMERAVSTATFVTGWVNILKMSTF